MKEIFKLQKDTISNSTVKKLESQQNRPLYEQIKAAKMTHEKVKLGRLITLKIHGKKKYLPKSLQD